MTWFKVDDNLAFHRKAVAAGNAAMGLWVRAGSLCAQQLTDGFIDAAIARQMGTKREIDALTRVGLWVKVDGGYAFHQWTERQPTRAQVEHERKLKTDRQRRWRDGQSGRYDKRDGHVDASTDASRDGDETALETAAPSRPVPTRPDYKNSSLSSSLTVRTARDAATDDDLKIEQKIIDLLAELTGVTVLPDWARRVRAQLLDGRDVAKPVTYVTRAISERPRDFLPSAQRPDAPPPNPLAGMPDPPPLGQRDNPANGPGLAAARAAIAAARKEET